MTLGYGTAALGRSLSARERLRLLETACDAGIAYFDTAPLYGAGAAEEALGRLRADVTIATKAGIVPPSVGRLALAKALRQAAPAFGSRFGPADVRRQLEGSLRRLRRDRIDVLLLHEVEPDAVTPLLDTLAALREEGKLLRWGIATNGTATAALLSSHAPDVVQLAIAEALDPGDAELVLHSVLAGRLAERPASALLRAAGLAYPHATILVGSRDERHIREAAAAVA